MKFIGPSTTFFYYIFNVSLSVITIMITNFLIRLLLKNMIKNTYLIKKRIDHNVSVVTNMKNDNILAMKMLRKHYDADMVYCMKREIAIHKILEHENIIKYQDDYESDRCIYLFTSYIDTGDLSYKLKQHTRFEETIAKVYIMEVIKGIKYLHDKYIVHRDIKTNNLLIDANNNIKIIDFGKATYLFDGRKSTTLCGTIEYLAPELCKVPIIPMISR